MALIQRQSSVYFGMHNVIAVDDHCLNNYILGRPKKKVSCV